MATAFDIGGLLGGNELSDFLSPQQQEAIQQRGLLSIASALLQAGGPSRTPIGLGQALGSALEAGQAGAERAQQSALTQILTKQKLDEARRAQELQGRIASILRPAATTGAMAAPGLITPEEALAAPGMAAGPTAARAALIGQERPAAPAMSPTEMKAGQYRQLADVMALYGQSEQSKRYMDIAESLAPTRQEVVGEPIQTATGWVQRTKTGGFIQLPKNFEPQIRVKPMGAPITVTDQASQKEILVQPYDDGTFKPLEGFGPKRDVVLQNVDGKIVAIDKAAVAPGTTFGTGRDLRLVTVDGKTEVVDLAAVAPGTTFGTGRDIRPVDVGGRIQFVDFSAIPPGTSLGKTLAPQVVGGAETGYFIMGGGGGAAPRAGAPAAASVAAPTAGAPAAAAAPAPVVTPARPISAPAVTAPAAAATAGAPAAGPQPVIPGTGPKPPEAFMKASKQLGDLRGVIADYKNRLDQRDSLPINPFSDDGVALSSRYNSLLIGVKNLFELGALAGPDMAIIERQLTNPVSLVGKAVGKSGIQEQIKVVEDMLTRAEANLESSYKQKIPAAAITPVQTPRGRFTEGQKGKDRSGRDIVIRNGQWVYE